MKQFRFQLIAGMRLCLALICLLWFGAPSVRALEHYVVPYNTSQANPYTGWATAGTNLIDVVNAAQTNPGPTRIVWVTNGTYYLTNQVYITNGITVISTGGATVIDGNNFVGKPVTNRCFQLNHAGAVLDGFTITRGYAIGGGGVWLSAGTVQNCVISNNVAFGLYWNLGGGGGLYLAGGTGQYCTIANNLCTNSGGGAVMVEGNRTLQYCTIINNTSSNHGGGVFMYSGFGALKSCRIAGNFAPLYGGGAYLGSTQQMISCTNDGNIAGTQGGGLFMQTGIASNCTLINNSVTSTAAGKGGGGANATSGGGLINCLISNNATAALGGGVYLMFGSCAFNCVISSNNALQGGGVNLNGDGGGNARLMLTNCLIQGNVASNGGGINVSYTSGTFETNWALVANCSIISNTAYGTGGFGGGAYIYACGGAEFRNCLFAYNTAAGSGGGTYLGPGNRMANCTIVSNRAGAIGGVYANPAGNPITNLVQNTIIYMNTSTNAGDTYSNYVPSYVCSYSNCCFAPAQTGDGTNYSANNITSDPRFVGKDSGNFRLAAGSPCVNAGVNRDWMTNAVDRDGRARLDRFSGRVDIGCYEHPPSGTMFRFR